MYRVFIAEKNSRQCHVTKLGYHYQMTHSSLSGALYAARMLADRYSQRGSGVAYLVPNLRRDLRANTIKHGSLTKIGYTTDGREMYMTKGFE